ncbi:MAG: hypothetical protein RDV41_12325, partial [Planctomycetota bacterium]|nr:hypothetical protein [Planctomycetota bacterium]
EEAAKPDRTGPDEVILDKVRRFHSLLRDGKSRGVDTSEAEKLDMQSREAAQGGDMKEAERLLDKAIELLEAQKQAPVEDAGTDPSEDGGTDPSDPGPGTAKTGQAASSREVRLRTAAARVEVVSALPAGETGSAKREEQQFARATVTAEQNTVKIDANTDPVWVVEGPLPEKKTLAPDRSPFGFHPASTPGDNYDCAGETGVTWDRGGLYVVWVFGQPDPGVEKYDWTTFDDYFKKIPADMLPLKNITIAMDPMVRLPGRPQVPEAKGRREVDVSKHLEGTTYRPKDKEKYARWVRAAVERYDGDGKDDMPGLSVAAKHWQADNEPPRGREGYADFVRITSVAIKDADADAKVLVGGLVPPFGGGMARAYEKESLPILKDLAGKHLDILDFHWFGYAGEWKLAGEGLARIRKDLRACGFEAAMPIWFTEMGTSSGTPAGRPGRPAPEQSERIQASEMVKRYSVLLGEGVEKIFWAWGMMEGFGDPRDNDFFDNTGFVYDGIGPGDSGKGVKKMVYWAHQKMSQLLQYWDGSRPEKVDVGAGAVAYRFKFTKDSDRGIVVVWTEGP